MKTLIHIVFLVFLLVSCDHTAVETQNLAPQPISVSHRQLQAIDSMMCQQPDSALALMMDFAARPQADSLEEYDKHYCQLLISELLYKNYSDQSNRQELLKAVFFFDTLCQSRGAESNVPTDEDVFLDARAHYINGVGLYERDSVVEACAEYLKTLEIMEGHFEEKELIGLKAKFMALTYNRLGELFSEQFMTKPAINCYENALIFCSITPTSPSGMANIYYRIGKQYDMMGQKIKANEYYTLALEKMPNNNNLIFRDLISTKALCEYHLGYGLEQSLSKLKQILEMANDENELLHRYLIIGEIYFEERIYDSAAYYLNPVFELAEIELQSEAANALCVIYDSLENKEKSNAYYLFLAEYKKFDWESKVLVSKLEELFKVYLNEKIKKEFEETYAISIKKAIIVSVFLVIIIFIVVKLRSKRLLNKQRIEVNRIIIDNENSYLKEIEKKESESKKELEERVKRYEKAIETDRQLHQMQKDSLIEQLKHSQQEVRELKDQIKQQNDLDTKAVIIASFNEEPICRLIMDRVKKGQFKSKVDYKIYKDFVLDKQQMLVLRSVVDSYFNNFTHRLNQTYPMLTPRDIDYCCLYLLGLSDADISALMQRAYSTINERSSKLKRLLGVTQSLTTWLWNFADQSLSI